MCYNKHVLSTLQYISLYIVTRFKEKRCKTKAILKQHIRGAVVVGGGLSLDGWVGRSEVLFNHRKAEPLE